MIYLDYHATTPVDPRVVDAMVPYFYESFGNPSSTVHRAGRIANDAVEQAREIVAILIGATPRETVFTSGATESNNLVIQGLARGNVGERKRIVTTSIEHKAVLAPVELLQKEGYEGIILPVEPDGRVNLEVAKDAITDNTLLVSVQAASNEIGTIQPIAELARIAHDRGAYFHTDAAQAVGKTPVSVNDWDVDLLSFSSHKLYGPKGVGVLYVRGGPYALPIRPLVVGGGQEHELRPGTLNVPAIVGLGEACRICSVELEEDERRTAFLRDRLEQRILGAIKNVRVNGALDARLPGNSSLTFPGIDAEALITNVPELAISTGSACTSGAPEPSHVLTAIGLDRKDAYSTIRIGIGRFTTEEEVVKAADLLIEAVERLVVLQAGL